MAKNDHEKSLEVLRAEMAMIQSLIEAKEAEEIEKKETRRRVKESRIGKKQRNQNKGNSRERRRTC